jgi:hypothetical protein
MPCGSSTSSARRGCRSECATGESTGSIRSPYHSGVIVCVARRVDRSGAWIEWTKRYASTRCTLSVYDGSFAPLRTAGRLLPLQRSACPVRSGLVAMADCAPLRDGDALSEFDAVARASLDVVRDGQFAIHTGMVALRKEARARGVLLSGICRCIRPTTVPTCGHIRSVPVDAERRPTSLRAYHPIIFGDGTTVGQSNTRGTRWHVADMGGGVERLRSHSRCSILCASIISGTAGILGGAPTAVDARGGAWQDGPGAALLRRAA